MSSTGRLRIEPFGAADALDRAGSSQQLKYLRCYFADLGARTVIEEANYFDRDYLSEFSDVRLCSHQLAA